MTVSPPSSPFRLLLTAALAFAPFPARAEGFMSDSLRARVNATWRSVQTDIYGVAQDQVEREITPEGVVRQTGAWLERDEGNGWGEEVAGMRLVACRKAVDRSVSREPLLAAVLAPEGWTGEVRVAPSHAGGKAYKPLFFQPYMGRRIYPLSFAPPPEGAPYRIGARVAVGAEPPVSLTLELPKYAGRTVADYTLLCEPIRAHIRATPSAANGKASADGWLLRVEEPWTAAAPHLADAAGEPLPVPVILYGRKKWGANLMRSGLPAGSLRLLAMDGALALPLRVTLAAAAMPPGVYWRGAAARLLVADGGAWCLACGLNIFAARFNPAVRDAARAGRLTVEVLPAGSPEFLGAGAAPGAPVLALFSARYPAGLFHLGAAIGQDLPRLLTMGGL